ncbi:MAG TPA: 5-amino-6-(D-ribitylamino)uracil--L-tyrosine 4-hydroxyphenyl transferase CofH [Nitrososphaeraceae archaeon]|nr:5-amino-6-(D-ribitylamino)uracil--L-tyrosine 4-hydroxyphenyl transferase CofH [Nitrososphaeraceae archaeon]
MNFESIQKYIDPVISEILDKALDNKEITISEVLELLDCKGMEMNMLIAVANYLRKNKNGDVVTYVLNRNINFTNVCIKRCGFCAFSRDFRQEEGYFLPTEEVIRRSKEAYQYGATEVCIQAGLPPKMDGNLYVELCKSIKKEIPNIHIHAFSPEEIMYGAHRSNISVKEYLSRLKDAGLDSIPGTAAEILDQEIRNIISPGRISVKDWIDTIKTAHSIGIPSTSTIMYGHIESHKHIAEHLQLIKNIQKETRGFTEFVPLSFVHTEAPMFNKNLIDNIKPGPDGAYVLKVHAVSRIFLNNYINNIQVSWVKEGPRMSQILLDAGVNDFGGTLINESISTSAGANNGQILKPKNIRKIIHSAGKIPAQRTSRYKIIKKFCEEDYDDEELLDKVDAESFGSYQELIKLDKFRFRKE